MCASTHPTRLGRLGSIADGSSSSAYGYDALDRLTSETVANPGAPQVLLTTGYGDEGQGARGDGLRTSFSAAIWDSTQGVYVPDFINRYAYDPLDRTTDVRQEGQPGGNPVAEKHVHFTYDENNRFEQIDRYAAVQTLPLSAADLADPAPDFVAGSALTYDGQGRLTGLLHTRDTDLPALNQYTWTFDAAGRLVQQVSADGTIDYGYDARGQLTGADYVGDWQADESYSYDAAGNRDTAGGSTYSTGDHNRMTSDGTYTYQYDAEGNRTARFVWTDDGDQIIETGETSQITQYTWDHRNRLRRIEYRPTEAGPIDWAVDYRYDFSNRRIARHLDVGGDADIDQSEYYVWDGSHVVLDFIDADGEGTAESLELARRYLWGAAVDQLLAQEEFDDGGPEDVAWPLTDHLGSVRDLLTDPDGTGPDPYTVTTHIAYDSFGNATATTGNLTDTRFLFTAQERDPTTGLYYYDARWYDAVTSVFLSEDPISFAAGDANLYRYVGNSPTNGTDPDGLEPVGHHIVPWSLFAAGPRSGRFLKKVSDDVFAVFDNARIANEYYNFHNFGPSKGVTHKEYIHEVEKLLYEYRKELGKQRGSRWPLPMKDMTKAQAEEFVSRVQSADGLIKRFLEGIRYEAEMAEKIGRKEGPEMAAKWGKAQRQAETTEAELFKLARKANLTEADKRKRDALQQTLYAARRRADDIASRVSIGRRLMRLGSQLADNKLVAKSGGRLLKALPLLGYAKSVKEDGFLYATVDEATDLLPHFWAVKLTLYFAVGPEEYERIKNQSWEEQTRSFVRGWDALTRGNPVGAKIPESQQPVYVGSGRVRLPVNVGMEFREEGKPDAPWSKVTAVYRHRYDPDAVVVDLEDGRRLAVKSYKPVK